MVSLSGSSSRVKFQMPAEQLASSWVPGIQVRASHLLGRVAHPALDPSWDVRIPLVRLLVDKSRPLVLILCSLQRFHLVFLCLLLFLRQKSTL